MEELKTADKLSTSAKGFIQAFSVSPMYVFFSTKVAVRIYHNMCKSNVLFLDAYFIFMLISNFISCVLVINL